MMFVWDEVAGTVARLYLPRMLCRLGLHRWRIVRKHSIEGVTVYFYGLPCKSHWYYAGEKCTRCGKRMRDGQLTWRHWLGLLLVAGPTAVALVLTAGWMALVYAALMILSAAIVVAGLVLVFIE